jgi:hypothetical protein
MDLSDDQYIVVCLDSDGDNHTSYVLATRQVFMSPIAAARYAQTVASSRNPLVIAGRFTELRFASSTAATLLNRLDKLVSDVASFQQEVAALTTLVEELKRTV